MTGEVSACTRDGLSELNFSLPHCRMCGHKKGFILS
jgi:hypothetical protein